VPDEKFSQQLGWLQLSERLSAPRLSGWKAQLPGPESRQALTALADVTEFLDLPASELPDKAVPNPAEQSGMISLTLQYVSRTIHQLPNFFATRIITSFQDLPMTRQGARNR
jgi:hypothetical protein